MNCANRVAKRAVRAFTLVEMLVVIAVLIIVATLAMPAMGPMFASNQTAATISTISSMLVTAQATAKAIGTPVGLRFERAYKSDDRGYIIDREEGKTPFDKGIAEPDDLRGSGFTPVLLDHQQIRMIRFSLKGTQAFELADPTERPVALPKDIWVAPGEWATFGWTSNGQALRETNLTYKPQEGLPYSPLDNFYMIFNAHGELVRYPDDQCYYYDSAQRVKKGTPKVSRDLPAIYPEGSAVSLVLYDRNKWNSINPNDGLYRSSLLARSTPLYINRNTGTVMEDRR